MVKFRYIINQQNLIDDILDPVGGGTRYNSKFLIPFQAQRRKLLQLLGLVIIAWATYNLFPLSPTKEKTIGTFPKTLRNNENLMDSSSAAGEPLHNPIQEKTIDATPKTFKNYENLTDSSLVAKGESRTCRKSNIFYFKAYKTGSSMLTSMSLCTSLHLPLISHLT